jgi:hypothetical protein
MISPAFSAATIRPADPVKNRIKAAGRTLLADRKRMFIVFSSVQINNIFIPPLSAIENIRRWLAL